MSGYCKDCKGRGSQYCICGMDESVSKPLLSEVAIAQVDFVYLMTQLDAIEILLREDNFKMYGRPSLEKMVITLKNEFEKYLSNVA
jgi:capsule polysaccharide export protein KpsC/LpsZ